MNPWIMIKHEFVGGQFKITNSIFNELHIKPLLNKTEETEAKKPQTSATLWWIKKKNSIISY